MNKKITIPLLVGFLIILSGILIYKKLNPKELPPYLVEAVGSVDGDVIRLNTKYPGRIVDISVDTGDKVKKGEVIAVIKSKEVEKKLKALEAEILAKRKELDVLRSKVDNNIKKAQLAVNIKQKEIKGVEIEIDSLQKVIAQDIKDEKRVANLVKKNLAKPHELEMAKLKTKLDKDKLKALFIKKEVLYKGLKVLKRDLEIAKAAVNSVKALEDGIKALEYKRGELSVMLDEFKLKSPIDGYVDLKVSNVGEVVGAGMPVVTLIDPKSFYVKIYVDEITNGKIKIGDEAVIFIDAFPNMPIKAKVSKIAQKAEFTPKEVAVRSDRITRVYEVRLKPIEVNPYLKLGLPAIGVVLIGNGSLPKSLSEIPVI